jgi:hypothetical protein
MKKKKKSKSFGKRGKKGMRMLTEFFEKSIKRRRMPNGFLEAFRNTIVMNLILKHGKGAKKSI